MYGAHHRVAPLRRGSGGVEGHAPTLNTLASTQSATQVMIPHTQLNAHTQSGFSAPRHSAAATTAYTLPATLSRSHLVPPSAPELPQNSQMSTASMMPSTQVQVSEGASVYAALSQTAQHHKETTAALLSAVESLRRQEKHMAAGSQSLAHISAIVDGQHAQVVALNELVKEVRGMVDVMKQAVGVLLTSQRADVSTTLQVGDGTNQQQQQRSPAELVLGADSQFTFLCSDGDVEEGAAAYNQRTKMRHVLLKGGESKKDVALPATHFEDDVFSM